MIQISLKKGEMGKSTRRSKERFVKIPHNILLSDSYISLSPSAKVLLTELIFQYNGRNNGDLSVEESKIKARNAGTKNTITKAVRELIASGLVLKTRDGQFCNPGRKCSLYALAWLRIDDCSGKLDIKATFRPYKIFR